MSSERLSAHFTGLPSVERRLAGDEVLDVAGGLRAEAAAHPRADDAQLARLRDRASGRTPPWIECGAWCDTHIVSPPSSGTATTPLFSIGTPARRWLTIVTSATASAPSHGSPPSLPNSVAKHTFEPVSGNSSGASAARPSAAVMTAGSGSMSANTCLGGVVGLRLRFGDHGGDHVADEPHPVAGEDRPVEVGRQHREALHRRHPEVVAGVVHGDDARHRRRRSPRSTELIVPWATGERTSATCSMPVSTRSSTYLPSPVSSVGSSSRSTALPKIEPEPAM